MSDYIFISADVEIVINENKKGDFLFQIWENKSVIGFYFILLLKGKKSYVNLWLFASIYKQAGYREE